MAHPAALDLGGCMFPWELPLLSFYYLCGGLQGGAMVQHRAAPPPPSPLVPKAFPFLMTGKVQPLSFTSSEDSRDCEEYDEAKYYSLGLNIVFLVSFHYTWHSKVQEYQ